MLYEVTHRTTYDYSAPVTVSHHAARLVPRARRGQELVRFDLSISPRPTVRHERIDGFGNAVAFFALQEVHDGLDVTARSRVRVYATEAPVLGLSPAWEQVVALFSDPVSPRVVDAYQFVFHSPLIRTAPDIAELARLCFPPGRPLLEAVFDLNRMVHREFVFDPEATTIATPLEEVLKSRRGVCQDFAHIGIACLRSLGLPARYVSGYIRTHAPAGKERLRGADASHGWFAAYCPELGWTDFDPTNDKIPGDEHIAVAYGRDYTDVAPISGILTGGAQHELEVAVDVLELPAEDEAQSAGESI